MYISRIALWKNDENV